jgi:tetratricopeptide (TPR) repeat protein
VRRVSGSRAASGRRPVESALALGLLALAAVAVVAAVLLSGGGGGGGDARPAQRPDARAQPGKRDQPATDQPATEQPPADEPAADQPATVDPARGVQLNEQGFALMGRGDFAGAVPILERAVASWPASSGDLNYAYALYNLGKSLNRAGRAADAIPYLEKRLRWNNQRATVQAELDLARKNAGQG